MMLAKLCEWLLESRCPPSRKYNERKRFLRHVLYLPLGSFPTAREGGGHRDQFRRMATEGLKPSTINGLRGARCTPVTPAVGGVARTGITP